VGGGAKFFELLASEDIDGDEMDLGVTVLASLGGGHVDDLARAVLDHDEAILPQGRALHGEGGRGAGIGGLEGVLMLYEQSVDLLRNAIEGDESQELRACAQPEVGRVRGLGRWTNNYLGIVRHLGCVCEVRIGSGEGLRLW